MKKGILFLTSLFFVLTSNAQDAFEEAYAKVPGLPKGILEAVSFSQTHMKHITTDEPESCTGLPRVYGLMGLTLDGKGYFKNNLSLVSTLSGISPKSIITEPKLNVLAYAKAFDVLMKSNFGSNTDRANATNWKNIAVVLGMLSELPDTGYANAYARDCQLYAVFSFLNDSQMAATYHFPEYRINLIDLFGADAYAVLTAKRVEFSSTGIIANGVTFPMKTSVRSVQYAPALWNPAPSCNYSSRAGTSVSAITIHTIQGSYAGAISWSLSCASSVSYHYVIRSSDGQVTQMVDEANKAWHVGSENPYTIGYEHEGYVTDPSWYTTAMYTSSADLSRDICGSGYGINPLRTYYGSSSSTTETLGGCTKIKGHQHYPFQTHTDPGIYWNWPYYYNLINNSTTPTIYTSSSGSFYDSGGSGGPYTNDERKLYLFQPSGASSVTLTFTAFDLETNWDYLFIYDGATTSSPLLGTFTGATGPGTITSTSGSLLVEFRSDCSTVNAGWMASWSTSSTPPSTADITAPTTAIGVPSTWVSADFTTAFTDADESGGSGVEKAFYQVIDFDGTDWRANATRGFYSDNFDLTAIHPDWTSVTGTWNITSSALTQSDQSLTNTNIYAYLNHGLSNRYLYNWSGKMEGTGTNRRAGFHYFCDAPTLTNRGNSYFVWFRLDDDEIEIYKVTSDVFTLQATIPYNFNAGQWYDYKVMYDRITGKTMVYVDNALAMTWTDSAPYSAGNYISFRSGNCNWAINNLKVYRSRATSTTVQVGPSGDLRYQNTDPLTPAGRIKTIINDNAGNLSLLQSIDINVDTTAPMAVSVVNDVAVVDEDTHTSTSNVLAYWSGSNDIHSGLARYWYALGTSPGATDVLGWTDNGWYDSVNVTGLSLTVGQTYYFGIKVENSVGLISSVTSSDGFAIIAPTDPPTANFYVLNSMVCQGECIQFTNTSLDATSYSWSFSGGDISSSTLPEPTVCFAMSGVYTVELIVNGPGGTDTLSQTIAVTVYDQPIAGFDVTNDTTYIPSGFVGFTNSSVNANGFYWEFGDGNSSTNEDPWNIYTVPGVYTVSMIAVNGPCENDTAFTTIVVLDPNGLTENLSSTGIYVYPNPADEWLYLVIPSSEEWYTVSIYNSIGELVFQNVVQHTSQFDISAMSKGLYHCQLRGKSSGISQVIPFVIK